MLMEVKNNEIKIKKLHEAAAPGRYARPEQ